MKASYASSVELEALLNPDHEAWTSVDSEPVSMMGTPVGMQPTAAIRTSWTSKKIGVVEQVQVAALHNGSELAFRLEWVDESVNAELTDTDSFPDAAAILFPVVPEAPLVTMGAAGQPVNAWYWRADSPEKAQQVTAEGLGTSHNFDETVIHGRGGWKDGRWQIVLARALQLESKTPVAQLLPGSETGVGFAIWEGSNSERAGIKSFSGNWIPLELTSAGSAANTATTERKA